MLFLTAIRFSILALAAGQVGCGSGGNLAQACPAGEEDMMMQLMPKAIEKAMEGLQTEQKDDCRSSFAPAGQSTMTCGSRIDWVMRNLHKSESEAKQQLVHEFPSECAACAPSPTGGSPASSPAGRSPASSPAVKCGIAASLNHCQEDKAYLNTLDSATASNINCMGYGGSSDPCTLNIQNDPDAGMNKDPSQCTNGVLFLWDEPYTQSERGHPEWGQASYIVKQWMAYSLRWKQQLMQKRSQGMKVTTPMFTERNGIKVQDKVRDFFSGCPSCNDTGSASYVDIIAWNAWIGSWNSDTTGQANWIIDQSKELKSQNGNREVWLGNFGYLGATSAQKQIDVIQDSGIFDANGGVDAVYYFCAVDVGGGSRSNGLTSSSGATTIGQALVAKCR